MTDNEIINDLEERIEFAKDFESDFTLIKIEGLKSTLDLINRQKAEIERLTINMNAFGLGMKREAARADNAKAEAYKEFAEGLKEMDGYNNHTFDDCASILISEEYKKGRYEKTREIWNTIDYLLKEKVGAENVD